MDELSQPRQPQQPAFTPASQLSGQFGPPPTRPQAAYTPPSAYVPQHAALAPRNSRRFNPPPNWPAPPPGWTPPPGWRPDPSWPLPPEGWQLWTDDPHAEGTGPRTSGAAVSARYRRRAWIAGVGILACVGLVSGIIAVNGNSSADGNSAADPTGGAAPVCYYSVQDMLGGSPFTVAIIGTSDCTNYAVGNSEFLVEKVNVPKGAGNAICIGQDRGNDGTVITTPDNYAAGEAYCESAGWTDLPSGN